MPAIDLSPSRVVVRIGAARYFVRYLYFDSADGFNSETFTLLNPATRTRPMPTGPPGAYRALVRKSPRRVRGRRHDHPAGPPIIGGEPRSGQLRSARYHLHQRAMAALGRVLA